MVVGCWLAWGHVGDMLQERFAGWGVGAARLHPPHHPGGAERARELVAGWPGPREATWGMRQDGSAVWALVATTLANTCIPPTACLEFQEHPLLMHSGAAHLAIQPFDPRFSPSVCHFSLPLAPRIQATPPPPPC